MQKQITTEKLQEMKLK